MQPGTSRGGVHAQEERTQPVAILRALALRVYDRENKTYCGRTCGSWAAVIGYYLIFLAVLLSYFLIVLNLTLWSIKGTSPPKSKQDLKSRTPTGRTALTAYPMVDRQLPVLWYSRRANGFLKQTNAIDSMFKRYDPKTLDQCMNCENMALNATRRAGDKPCKFDPRKLGPCSKYPYGYDSLSPCFYLKVNRVFQWKPKAFTRRTRLPAHLPEDLADQIQSSDSESIWVVCKGMHPWDEEHIGKIVYYPSQNIKTHFFPYTNHPNYLSPLIAVQIFNVTEKVLITIECTLWEFGEEPSSTTVVLYVG